MRRMVLDALGDRDAEAWLFASRAQGDVRQHSDIDVAILPWDHIPATLLAEFAADLEDSVVPYDVDLVDLRNADPALVEEVRRDCHARRAALYAFVLRAGRLGFLSDATRLPRCVLPHE